MNSMNQIPHAKPDTVPALPASLPGFEHIKRVWNSSHECYMADIKPGDFYVTNNPLEMISTTLGSCVAACIRDKQANIGGMNHFMLPLKDSVYAKKFSNHPLLVDATRYGNWAMEYLINEILKYGGVRRNLEVKVFGGGRVLHHLSDIGEKNVQFVLQYIYNENLVMLNKDVGDVYPRKILYCPFTGVVKVKKLRAVQDNTIMAQEESYLQKISAGSIAGDVELF